VTLKLPSFSVTEKVRGVVERKEFTVLKRGEPLESITVRVEGRNLTEGAWLGRGV
jgi:hypothetical protein